MDQSSHGNKTMSISRRRLFALTTTVACLLLSCNRTENPSVTEAPMSPETISSFQLDQHDPMARAVDGERYEALVPDTLDLADRMGLSLNALTSAWLPEERWALGFNVDLSRREAILRNFRITDAYLNIPPKFLEAMVLCRLASGSTRNLSVDRQVLASRLALVGEDGLSYAPSDTLSRVEGERGHAEVWGEGRMLIALSMLAQVDDDPRWGELGRRKVDRLLELTREKEGFRYFWTGRFRPAQVLPADAGEPTPESFSYMYDHVSFNPTLALVYSMGSAGHGAALFHRVTGYAPALELARGLARWALTQVFFNPDGRYDFYHFHHGLYALIAIT